MEQQQLPPSEQLLQARTSKQWSLESLAKQLNLPVATLSALEKADYEVLHGSAYVIAHMRAYAQLLGLNAQDLVTQYKAEYLQSPEQEVRSLQSAFIKDQHKKYKTAYGVAAAAVLLLLLAVLSPDNLQLAANDDSSIIIDTSYGSTYLSNVQSLPDENPTQGLLPDVVTKAQLSDGVENIEEALQEVSELAFHFTADCWVEVFDGEGQRIYAALQKSDQTLELSGKPPFRISLGYAPGVELSYNGEPVSITASSANVAQLVVGNT